MKLLSAVSVTGQIGPALSSVVLLGTGSGDLLLQVFAKPEQSVVVLASSLHSAEFFFP